MDVVISTSAPTIVGEVAHQLHGGTTALLCYNSDGIGAWRSLVAHLHGVQGVGGSNPLAPTNETRTYTIAQSCK